MAKKKKVVEPTIEQAEEIVETPGKPATVFSVYDAKGEFVRTYSVELHGEGAGQLAKGYAEKIGGLIK